jgi:hypothetical protein
MVFEAILVLAAAIACPTDLRPANQWGFPDEASLCQDRDYHECLAAIEHKMMTAADGAVTRVDDTLYFRIRSDDECFLRDDKTDRFASVSYRYWGQSDAYYLVRLQFYEGSWFALLNKDTARLTKVIRGGLPLISPDRKWMASASIGTYGQTGSTVDVWLATHDGFERVFEARFRGAQYGRFLLHWEGSTHVHVCWHAETMSYLGSLALNKRGDWGRAVHEE